MILKIILLAFIIIFLVSAVTLVVCVALDSVFCINCDFVLNMLYKGLFQNE